ncbi:tautomerase family protein [Pseudonocardia xishanensis]|uniref:4-oxalocrotonate tautomerase-like domain-containing protein n=1 Tax=Pseudonocardia xishanensis TaxID=630995 RepID=A0ABP8RRQ9_9PSEU
MPLIHVQLVDGPTAEQRREFLAAVTDAACTHLGVARQSVRVWLTPIAADDFMAGGVTAAERRAEAARSATGGA